MVDEKHEHDRLSDDGNPHVPEVDVGAPVAADTMPTAEQLAEYDAETVRIVNAAERKVSNARASWESLKADAADAKKTYEARTDDLRKLIRDREEARGQRPEPTLLDQIAPSAKWRDVRVEDLDIHSGIKAHLSFDDVKTAGELYDAITSFNSADGTPFGLALGDVADIRMALGAMADREANAVAFPADLWRQFPIGGWTRFGLAEKDIDRLEAGEIKKETTRFPIKTVGDLADYSTPTGSGWTRRLTDIKGIGGAGAERVELAQTEFWAWWNNGGESEFARERGVTNGTAALSGSGSEGSSERDSGEAIPGDDEFADAPNGE